MSGRRSACCVVVRCACALGAGGVVVAGSVGWCRAAGEVALEAADRFAAGLAFGCCAGWRSVSGPAALGDRGRCSALLAGGAAAVEAVRCVCPGRRVGAGRRAGGLASVAAARRRSRRSLAAVSAPQPRRPHRGARRGERRELGSSVVVARVARGRRSSSRRSGRGRSARRGQAPGARSCQWRGSGAGRVSVSGQSRQRQRSRCQRRRWPAAARVIDERAPRARPASARGSASRPSRGGAGDRAASMTSDCPLARRLRAPAVSLGRAHALPARGRRSSAPGRPASSTPTAARRLAAARQQASARRRARVCSSSSAGRASTAATVWALGVSAPITSSASLAGGAGSPRTLLSRAQATHLSGHAGDPGGGGDIHVSRTESQESARRRRGPTGRVGATPAAHEKVKWSGRFGAPLPEWCWVRVTDEAKRRFRG